MIKIIPLIIQSLYIEFAGNIISLQSKMLVREDQVYSDLVNCGVLTETGVWPTPESGSRLSGISESSSHRDFPNDFGDSGRPGRRETRT